MPDLTFQLYSGRNTELNTALEIVAAAGFSSVEAYGENLKDKQLFKNALQATGLTMASVHIGLDQLQKNLPATMDTVSELGATHVVCPYLQLDDRPSDRDGWVQLAAKLGGINETLASNGFTFAWHNHDFEFSALPDGSTPMALLLESASGVQWEADIGWIVRAGASASEWLQQYADRVSALHLKDLAASGECLDEDGWADAGYGVIDWSALMSDIKNTSAKYFIAEHDNPSDLKRFAGNSFQAISSWDW